MQKSIRRGLVENAALVAYELYASGAEAEDQVWSRLRIISVEDVGFGNLNAPLLIQALDEFRRSTSRQTPDRLIFLVHAVRVLATSQKDRTSDEMATWVRQAVERGEAQPDVFDVALDMHTRRGREMGRDFRHWFAEGARVENEIPDRDLTYRRRLEASLDRPGGAQ
ncbi:MAG: AAA family ATPase [Chloroflexi bacterium]|nr:AAA family ATPase [Chloroflexota bacterium]